MANSTKKSAAPKARTRVAKVVKKAAPKRAARRTKKEKTTSLLGPVKTYPFASKRDILTRIESDSNEAIAALVQLHTLDAGMCSQKKAIATLAGEVSEAGESAAQNDSLVARCRAVVRHYGRRLAKEARAVQLKANPELAALAETFSATV